MLRVNLKRELLEIVRTWFSFHFWGWWIYTAKIKRLQCTSVVFIGMLDVYAAYQIKSAIVLITITKTLVHALIPQLLFLV